ncbi:solute carrier family 28 member 3-like [Mercenaria mercenaria]|uniref:solute carrier family 28 member 3-like n=1 Tax=Mercenaria mercenaria TaxID=6596 RepID=UPI00234F27FC|nr:solute carrier family 28 member 3-like [Mercenaria mercenaria]
MSVEMIGIKHRLDHETDNNVYENNGFEHGDTETVTDILDEELKIKEIAVEEEMQAYQKVILSIQESVGTSYKRHSKIIWTTIYILLLLAYCAYLSYALYFRFGDEGSWRLLGFSVFGIALIVIMKLYRHYESDILRWLARKKGYMDNNCTRIFGTVIAWVLRLGVLIFLIVYIVIDVALDQPQNLVCVAGLLIYILLFFITSANPAKVNWHAVFWGIALQYIFALMILRTVWGYNIFKWLGDRATEFLEYVVAGAEFVFGQSYEDHYFAMKVLSTIIFFFSFINILYYLGVMQAIIKVLGRFLAFCLGTTAAESINAAANIFVDMQGACLIVRPYLKTMTRSELHAVMTGGFSTIAGSVLGAYISFGVPANHLLSASVMSAPAALALSKLSYPETERRKDADDFSRLESSNERNLIDAASNGALASLKIVGAIAANVIAFMSMLAFINATLTWFGDRVGVENLTFELITSYVFYPVAFFMGIETSDCRKVAELIGVKTFTNEFVAYSRLKDLIANRHSLENYTSVYNTSDWYWNDDNVVFNITGEVLKGGVITIKSEVIVTYALCGFANLSAIGSQLGALTALAPTRRADLVQIVFRAMVCGNVACFLTACTAGLLYKEF